MQCNGGEKSIDLCKSRGWGNSDCTHDEDAGVVCKDERLPGFVDSNVIDVRLVGRFIPALLYEWAASLIDEFIGRQYFSPITPQCMLYHTLS